MTTKSKSCFHAPECRIKMTEEELRELQLWGERLVMRGAYDSRKQHIGEPDEPQWRISNITVSDAAIYHGNYFGLVLPIC